MNDIERAEAVVVRVYGGLSSSVTPKGHILIGEIAAALSAVRAEATEAIAVAMEPYDPRVAMMIRCLAESKENASE